VRGLDPAPERRPPAHEVDARSDFHGEKQEGKIDPSRGRAAAGDTLAGGRDDRGALPDSAGDAGWLGGVADGEIFHGSGNCNNAGPGHSGDTDKTPCRREESGTPAGEKLRHEQPAPVRERSTGQPAPIMAG